MSDHCYMSLRSVDWLVDLGSCMMTNESLFPFVLKLKRSMTHSGGSLTTPQELLRTPPVPDTGGWGRCCVHGDMATTSQNGWSKWMMASTSGNIPRECHHLRMCEGREPRHRYDQVIDGLAGGATRQPPILVRTALQGAKKQMQIDRCTSAIEIFEARPVADGPYMMKRGGRGVLEYRERKITRTTTIDDKESVRERMGSVSTLVGCSTEVRSDIEADNLKVV